MRISDWSSDVYSSDLAAQRIEEIVPAALQEAIDGRPGITQVVENIVYAVLRRIGHECVVTRGDRLQKSAIDRIVEGVHAAVIAFPRSEEHTSELQSLMRISYAVFCLKKKKTITSYTNT